MANQPLDVMLKTKGAIHDDQNIHGFFGEYRFLSNFHVVPILYKGLTYPSVENAYMAQKTRDKSVQRQFLNYIPSQARKMGQIVELRPDWEEVKYSVMLKLNRIKFNNKELKQALLATGIKHLEETNYWGDRFWGVCEGVGENHLGNILMKIRDEINAKNKP